MRRETLLDFFEDISALPDRFVVHDDGYRVREMTYQGLADAAREFASTLRTRRVGAGEKVVIWSENSAEWLVAFWGCLIEQVVVVPVDYRASADLLARIARTVRARAVLIGAEVPHPPEVTGEVWPLRDLIQLSATPVASRGVGGTPSPVPSITGSTLAEIIFTSGATAEPKGVTITHRNILANVIPIEREIAKYRKWARPFHPLRFLNLLPLSHMFGQSMATFVPPLLSGTVIFSHGFNPAEIVRQIRTRRVSVLVCVPKVLDVLREHVQRVVPHTAEPDPLAGRHWLWRWWHYRDVHRMFGWKFWCVVSGAAPLDADLEAFWRKLGLPVIQGYGLTETAPVVTLNHPFHSSRGTVGTPIPGVEVRIADDGEILVRGDNVSSGYYVPDGTSGAATPPEPTQSSGDGWFHTGDIGAFDASGRLLIKGRKKEMIVTPQGLNVFPEDVERALLAQPGVRDAGVVGLRTGGEERIHAVLLLEAGTDVHGVVRAANAGLEDHQRVWSAAIWPGAELPRTEGTRKLKRRELQQWASGQAAPGSTARTETRSVAGVLSRYAAGRPLTPETTLDELGLSSLDRVELMMALEEAFQTTMDEAALAGPKTIAEIERQLVEVPAFPSFRTPVSGTSPSESQTTAASTERGKAPPAPPIAFPSWNRSPLAWFVRRVSLPTWILPLGRIFVRLEVQGLSHLSAITGPVLFAANHQSHMDTPVVLMALPPRLRYRLAPAMAKEFFASHFARARVGKRSRFRSSLLYYLACEFFNAFPLPQREAGTRQTLRYIGEILADGYSVLIFPEGKRTQTGEIGTFRPGAAMIGARLEVPVVPVRLDGLDKVLPTGATFPTRGRVRIAFGPPLRLSGQDYAAMAKQVEDAVRWL